MDNRLIENINEYQFQAERLQELRPVFYYLKGTDKRHIGLIAQDLQNVLPVLVENTSNGLIVDYEKLSVVLLAALKEMNDRISALEKQKKKTK